MTSPSPPPLQLVAVAAAVALIMAAIPYLQVNGTRGVLCYLHSFNAFTSDIRLKLSVFLPLHRHRRQQRRQQQQQPRHHHPRLNIYNQHFPRVSIAGMSPKPQTSTLLNPPIHTPSLLTRVQPVGAPGLQVSPNIQKPQPTLENPPSLSFPNINPPPQLLFMGIVIDVRSAKVFYGKGQGCSFFTDSAGFPFE
jgi:hypothetical protein